MPPRLPRSPPPCCSSAGRRRPPAHFDRAVMRSWRPAAWSATPGRRQGRAGPDAEGGRRPGVSGCGRRGGDDMPPKKPLPDAEKAVLKAWIDAGAIWARPDRPFARTVTTRAGRDWCRSNPQETGSSKVSRDPRERGTNPVDAFILAKLADNSCHPPTPPTSEPSSAASTSTCRLPPTYEQVERSPRQLPDAYEKLIDKLLASPHYGERWGRHWLDVARYAETAVRAGPGEAERVEYRDWVIAAVTPICRSTFVREQRAGDELPNVTEQSVIATGSSAWHLERRAERPAEYQYDRLEEMVGATSRRSRVTVGAPAARHKFDPSARPTTTAGRGVLGGPIPPGPREHLAGRTTRRSAARGCSLDRPGGRCRRSGCSRRATRTARPVFEPATCRPSGVGQAARPTADGRQDHHPRCNWRTGSPTRRTAAGPRVCDACAAPLRLGAGAEPDNLGFTGDQPTPDLLDGWRPSSSPTAADEAAAQAHPPTATTGRVRSTKQDEYAKRDAANNLWWRAGAAAAGAEACGIRCSRRAAT